MTRFASLRRGRRSPPGRLRAPGPARRARLIAAAAGFGALAATLAAADPDAGRIIFPNGGSHGAGPAASGGMANLFTLVVAVLLAAVGGWLFWRNRRSAALVREGRLLTIEETRSLGNRQFLVVTSYGDQKFLLGVCPGKIDLLAPLGGSRGPEGMPR